MVGDPTSEATTVGPVVSRIQFDRVEGYIGKGDRGRRAPRSRRPWPARGVRSGLLCAATVFSDVRNDMAIAREEIFGPVLCILPYGGFKKSGNGREWGIYGLRDFLEVKALTGVYAD
jgi:aldehyde dehydrogenase (NAD+)